MSVTETEYLYLARAIRRGFRALVVDDHEANRQVLVFLLERLGATVIVAHDGAQAVAKFGSEFDLVLMDLRMPVMDGFEAIRRIRDWEARNGGGRVPVIVTSAHTTPMDIERARQAGADQHMAKPLNLPFLLKVIDQALTPVILPSAIEER